MEHRLDELAAEIGLTLHRDQVGKLETYRSWLADEALVAGGIGPEEVNRLDTRHLADSLLFLAGFPWEASEVWDLGTGVGLPGIPLAIALPDTEFRLIDRSVRRVTLTRRAIRILDLPNCTVIQDEIEHLVGTTPVVVSRASLSPTRLAEVVRGHLETDGVAVVGGSWTRPPDHPGWEVMELVSKVLDRTVWLLIMRPG